MKEPDWINGSLSPSNWILTYRQLNKCTTEEAVAAWTARFVKIPNKY